MPNSLNLDMDKRSVGPDLCTKCLQKVFRRRKRKQVAASKERVYHGLLQYLKDVH